MGTAEDVTYRDGRVYVAAGGAGIAAYLAGDLSSRVVYSAPFTAKDIDWVSGHLAAAAMGAVHIFEPGIGTELTLRAKENIVRRHDTINSTFVRIASAVAGTEDGRLYTANWDHMDAFDYIDKQSGTAPDINTSAQRMRFHPDGETKALTIENSGEGDLVISSLDFSAEVFSADYSGSTLAPGEEVVVNITYTGGGSSGAQLLVINSNDPDENPLPVQVIGQTNMLDQGEVFPDFTLQGFRQNPTTYELEPETFTLSDHAGKVVWLGVYASW